MIMIFIINFIKEAYKIYQVLKSYQVFLGFCAEKKNIMHSSTFVHFTDIQYAAAIFDAVQALEMQR